MKKVKNLFLAIAIVGLLVSVSIIEVRAGGGIVYNCDSPLRNECVRCCRGTCADPGELIDCSGATGDVQADCRLLNNIFIQCCVSDCMEKDCGVEASDSIVCEALEHPDLCHDD